MRLEMWARDDARRAWLSGGIALLLAAVVMAFVASVVYGHDSVVVTNLHATRVAVVSAVSGPNYAYVCGICKCTGSHSPPLAVGAQVVVHYNPNDQCQSTPGDPIAQQRTDLAWLLGFSVVFSLGVGSGAWDFARRR